MIKTNLRRHTFESPKIKKWVEGCSQGNVLNLFCGPTKLNLNEIRVDVRAEVNPDYVMDALEFVKQWKGGKFDTVLLDPPYSYRKAMEMYEGKYTSRFKQIAETLPNIIHQESKIISFGYHSTFMGNKRGYELEQMCVFAHGGAQHCTIAIIEKLK